MALLEADVNLNVVKELIEHVRAKAMGRGDDGAFAHRTDRQDVRDELVELLGKDTARFKFASRAADGDPDGRAAGLGQDDDQRQAGGVAEEGRAPADAGLGGRLSAGGA